MLESPDYFFRVREVGRLRQTRETTGEKIRLCQRYIECAWTACPGGIRSLSLVCVSPFFILKPTY